MEVHWLSLGSDETLVARFRGINPESCFATKKAKVPMDFLKIRNIGYASCSLALSSLRDRHILTTIMTSGAPRNTRSSSLPGEKSGIK
jgi:hypothetical protein